jgi:two-component system, NtrC family, sensor kinase
MELTFLPIWIVGVGGAALMIILSCLCVRYAVLLRRQKQKSRRELQAARAKLLDLNQNLERLVDERTRALAMSEHKYRRIFEESRDLILLTRQDGRIIDINPAGGVMLGLKENADGVNFSDYFHESAEWQRLMAELGRLGFVSSVEVDLKTGDGERKQVLLSGSMAADGDGPAVVMHFMVKDVEQQRLMREQMVQADRLASIGEFSSGIAHEINNPLGIILGYTQLMLRNEPGDSDRAADLKTIEKQVRHCKSIVEDLLNFARTTAPTREMCDIHGLLDDVLQLIRQHSTMDGIRVQTEYDPGVGRISLDKKKMRQVFINLLTNARQAVGTQGTITVSTGRKSDDRSIHVRVRDTGSGIEAEHQRRIFDPFFTTKPTSQGTGLGLAVSYGIIKNHGGDIWVESTPGQGAVFTVELPITAASGGKIAS